MNMNTYMVAAVRRGALLSSAVVALAGCASETPQAHEGEVSGETREALGVNDVPQIDFSDRPSYLANNVLALTFDDGPDWNNTAKVLDVLRAKQVRASFFINTENWSNVPAESAMQDLVRRMVNEGHTLGNHTVHHPHLSSLDSAGVEGELAGVENVVRDIFGANGPRLTLFRAPFGEPYQAANGGSLGADFDKVASVVKRHAVHVGWGIDTSDYACPVGDADCVYDTFTRAVGTPGNGSYGVVLMHSVHSQTAGAIGRIIDYAKNHGFVFRTAEDVVRARFGRSSAELVGGGTSTTTGPQSGQAYTFRAVNSGKVADVVDVSRAYGAEVQQWTDYRAYNQRFTLRANSDGTFGIVTFAGLCLDVSGASTANGARVIQWGCHTGANQKWRFEKQSDGSFAVRAVGSSKCLDVSSWSTADGARLQQWDCSTGSNQRFRLEP